MQLELRGAGSRGFVGCSVRFHKSFVRAFSEFDESFVSV